MGYYMRYFVESGPTPRMEDISAMCEGTEARLDGETLKDGEEAYAIFEILEAGTDVFEEEIGEFHEFIEDSRWSLGKRRVEKCLKNCTCFVAVQVLFGTRGTDATLAVIEPFWERMGARNPGLIQADGEGFYSGRKLILALE
ncbi:MAG: hypothetical protein K8R88_15830 [Armatimonadetes bacterium]|nr:hypothetical protein [Armatimonadota bacterium]